MINEKDRERKSGLKQKFDLFPTLQADERAKNQYTL